MTIERSKIVDGIEFYRVLSHDGNVANIIDDCQCARCGSSCTYVSCDNCGGEGSTEGHTVEGWDSDEPEDRDRCDYCRGRGGWYRCLASRDWCQENPAPGREDQPSSAIDDRDDRVPS